MSSIHKTSLFHILLENIFDFYGIFGNLIFLAIVFDTIIKNKLHIVNVLLYVVIDIVIKFSLNSTEVHRFLNDFKIVINAKFDRVNRFQEEVTPLGLIAQDKNPLCNLNPCLFSLKFLDIGHVNLVWVPELFL